MAATLVDWILRGRVWAWIPALAVVVVAAIAVWSPHQRPPGIVRVLLLSALVSVLAAGGFLVATALAVPKLVWKPVEASAWAAPEGETWRVLRGPIGRVAVEGRPEVAVPAVDNEGRWRLFGFFSGLPLDFAPAPPEAPGSGGTRLCSADGRDCRAWPKTWPDPVSSARSADFIWIKTFEPGVLAFDASTGLYLQRIELTSAAATAGRDPEIMGNPQVETAPGPAPKVAVDQAGRLTGEPARGGEGPVVTVRRISDGRLDAVRVVSKPSGETTMFQVERASVSLTTGPTLFRWILRWILFGALVFFPFVTVCFQVAPAWWTSKQRRMQEAKLNAAEAKGAASEGAEDRPLPSDPGELAREARAKMAEKLHGWAIFAVGVALTAPAVLAIAAWIGGR